MVKDSWDFSASCLSNLNPRITLMSFFYLIHLVSQWQWEQAVFLQVYFGV